MPLPKLHTLVVAPLLALVASSLAPVAARAEPPAARIADAAPTVAPDEAVIATSTSAPAQRPRVERVGREVVGGALALAGSAVVAAGLFVVSDQGGDFGWLRGAYVGGGLGIGATLLAVPWGVMLLGDGAGGNGRYWASLVGSLVGAAGGVGLIVIAESESEDAIGPAVGAAFALQIAGAIVGYELSTHDEPEAPAVIPVFAPTDGGAFLGVATVF